MDKRFWRKQLTALSSEYTWILNTSLVRIINDKIR